MITDRVLFACHKGTVGNNQKGILFGGHSLLLAIAQAPVEGVYRDDTFLVLWESSLDIEEFFETIGLSHVEDAGLWVYSVTWDPDAIDFNDEDMPWLAGGTLRRPFDWEMSQYLRGEAPWGGRLL
jgi:hypothetical protein